MRINKMSQATKMKNFFATLDANEEMCQETLYKVFYAFMKFYGEPADDAFQPDHLEAFRDAWGDIADAPADCRCGGCRTYNAWVACETRETY